PHATGRSSQARCRELGSQHRGGAMNLNLSARAGRWSAGHWKTAVSAWLAFCIVAVALGAVAGTRMLKQTDTAAGGAKRGEKLLGDAGSRTGAGESVPGQAKTETFAAPAFRATVTDVVRAVSALPQVERIRSPLAPANAGQVAHDRRSALVQFE